MTESINTSRLTASWSRLSIHVERAGSRSLASKFANKYGKADRQAERRTQAQRAKGLAKQRKKAKPGGQP